MKRLPRTLLVLLLLQAVLVGLYLAIEARRSSSPSAPSFAWEALDEPAPPLPAPAPTGEAYLVHFWATWCAPCREELPALLAASAEEGVPLLALTDEPRADVERFFGGEVPPAVLPDPGGEAARAWRVSGLPDTFLVREGRVVARMGGPRDWRSSDARRFLRQEP